MAVAKLNQTERIALRTSMADKHLLEQAAELHKSLFHRI